MMALEKLSSELATIYQGSGYSMSSVADYLHTHHTHGFNDSYDGTAGMAYYDGFKVFFSPFGYEIIVTHKEGVEL